MRRKKFLNEYNKMRIFFLLLSYLLVGHSQGQNHQQKKARLSSHHNHNKLTKGADQYYESGNGNTQKIGDSMSISGVEKNIPVNLTFEGGKSKVQHSNGHKLFSNIADNNRGQKKQVSNVSHNQIDQILSKKFEGISNKARVLSSAPQQTGNHIPTSISFPPLATPQLPQMPTFPTFNFPSLPANNINPISPQTNPTNMVNPFIFPTTNLNNFQSGVPVSPGSFSLPPYQAYPNLFQNYNPYSLYSYNQYLPSSTYPLFQGYSTFPFTYPGYQGSTMNPTSPSTTPNTAEIRANIENEVFNAFKSKYTNQLPASISPSQSSLNITLTAPNGSSAISSSFGDFMKTFNNPSTQSSLLTVNQSKSLPTNIDMSSIYAAFNKPINWPQSFNTSLTYKPPTFDEQMKKTYDPANQKIYSFNDPKIAEMFKQISGKSISQVGIKSTSVPLTDVKAQKTRKFQNQLRDFQNTLLHKRLLQQNPTQQKSSPHTRTYMSYSQYMRMHGSLLKQFFSLQISSYRQQIYQKNLNFIQNHNADINQQYQMGINLFTAIDKLQFLHRYTIQQKINYLPHIKTSNNRKFQYHNNAYFNTLNMPRQIVDKSDDLEGILSYSFVPHYRAPDSQAWAILSTIQQPYKSYCHCNCAFPFQQALSQVARRFYSKSVYEYSKRIYQYAKDYGINLKNNILQHEKCKSCLKTGKGKIFLKGFTIIQQGNCKKVLKRLKIQAVSASIAAQDLQFYQSGTFTTNSSKLNHEIVVLGFDSKKGYLVKNSWGPQWGQKGLAYVSESCGVCRYATYPILSFLDTE